MLKIYHEFFSPQAPYYLPENGNIPNPLFYNKKALKALKRVDSSQGKDPVLNIPE